MMTKLQVELVDPRFHPSTTNFSHFFLNYFDLLHYYLVKSFILFILFIHTTDLRVGAMQWKRRILLILSVGIFTV
jgi:hypothetical protein